MHVCLCVSICVNLCIFVCTSERGSAHARISTCMWRYVLEGKGIRILRQCFQVDANRTDLFSSHIWTRNLCTLK